MHYNILFGSSTESIQIEVYMVAWCSALLKQELIHSVTCMMHACI